MRTLQSCSGFGVKPSSERIMLVYINIDFPYFRSIKRVWAETSVFRFKLSYDFVHLTDYFPPYLAFSLSFSLSVSLCGITHPSLPSLNFAIVPEPSLPKKLWLYVGDKLIKVKLPSWEHYKAGAVSSVNPSSEWITSKTSALFVCSFQLIANTPRSRIFCYESEMAKF